MTQLFQHAWQKCLFILEEQATIRLKIMQTIPNLKKHHNSHIQTVKMIEIPSTDEITIVDVQPVCYKFQSKF